MIKYAKSSRKSKLIIVDVGCSTGVSLKQVRTELNGIGVDSYIKGIDMSVNIRDEALKNMDEFINADILTLEPEKSADVVICSKMAVLVLGDRRANILRKSAEFLKDDGALITDADCFEQIGFLAELLQDIKDNNTVMMSLGSLRYGWQKFREERERRINLPYKRQMHMIEGRENALDYPRHILEGWNKLHRYQKFRWEQDIRMKALREKLFPVRPKHK